MMVINLEKLIICFAIVNMVIILSGTTSSSRIALSLPGCPNKCGNITIPYPFGIQEGCYLSETYRVNCTTLQLPNATFKLVDISLDGLMHASLPVAYRCFNSTDEINKSPGIRLSRFRLSNTMNLLATVGCHAVAYVFGFPRTEYNFVIKSLARNSCKNLTDGSCSGQGCMEVPFPYRFENFRITVGRGRASEEEWSYNNCTYGFLVQRGGYKFHTTDIDNMQNRSFPVVLEWTVGDTTCEKAKDESSYICKENSVCEDYCAKIDKGQAGYSCHCAPGYRGNPYLPNGCQDINECEKAEHDCIHGCVNTNGSDDCMCPVGMRGDGRRKGTGCSEAARSLNNPLYVAIGSSIAASVVFTLILYWGLRQRRIMKSREMFFKNNGGLILQKILFESKQSSNMAKIFTARILEKATNNFHKANIIGEGGYGIVYKGTLEDNTMVAIKKSRSIDTNQIEQFINEVIMLSETNHPNIVRLLGCCLETQTPLLVYEFVTNKTLYHHLHEKDDISSMTFERRLNIATQTAEALAHIHSTTKIIHRDIKSSNILLTDDYTVKVSDFGISRFIPLDQSHIKTLVHGTLGYIDPEYFRSGILTNKSDVYSFGMVLVELITSRKVYSQDGTESDLGLAMFFVSFVERGCLIEILDDQGKKDGIFNNIIHISNVAKNCIEVEGKKRPTMEEVKDELEKLRQSFIKGSIFNSILN